MILSLLRSLASGAELTDILPGILFTVIVVIFSLSFHEMAHGFIAYKLGDPTARNLGRITLNPAKHLDPMGTICMMLVGFGWARPVIINSRNFKNPRKGMAISAAAGPISNLLISFTALLIYAILVSALHVQVFLANDAQIYISVLDSAIKTLGEADLSVKILYFFTELLYYFHILNLYLAVFNLLPIPPLDGSKILYMFLPSRLYYQIQRNEQIIYIVLLALLITGSLSGLLSTVAGNISTGMIRIIQLIPGL